MARYEHLPIYKQTYDMMLLVMQATKTFPREYKYTIGQNLKDELIEMVVSIYRANSALDKVNHIQGILDRIQVVHVLIRVAHDMRIMQRKHYARLAEMTDSLSRQASGWIRSSGKAVPEQVGTS